MANWNHLEFPFATRYSALLVAFPYSLFAIRYSPLTIVRGGFAFSRPACYSRSTMVTFAMPPPSHMVCRPYRLFCRFSALTSVVISLVPEPPSG
jgi:hypothetical protein